MVDSSSDVASVQSLYVLCQGYLFKVVPFAPLDTERQVLRLEYSASADEDEGSPVDANYFDHQALRYYERSICR
jgi:hypothetical protein